MKSMMRAATLLCLVCLFAVIASASVETLNFDSFAAGNGVSIQSASPYYGGLNWVNFYALNAAMYQTAFGPSGYDLGVVSTPNVAFNGFGKDAKITSPSKFNLVSGYFTPAFNTGLPVTVTGYDGATQLYQTTFTLNLSTSTTPVLETFNFNGVTSVVFSTTGCGTTPGCQPYAPFSGTGQGQNFVLDDLTISGSPAATPEPASLLLLASGGLLGMARLRKAVR